MSNSRRASSPTTKKKNAIRPALTHSLRSSVIPWSPTAIASSALQSRLYDDASILTQTNAATVAASRIAALPVSVDRKSRSGVGTLRAQAVVPASVCDVADSDM